jgi:hypothetical protein
VSFAVAEPFAGAASALALAALLAPLAFAASRRLAERPDPGHTAAVGIAAVAALLVLAGLGLSAVGGLSAAGWLAVVVAADAVVLLAVGDRSSLGRRAVTATLASAALGLVIGAVALSRSSAVDHERDTKFTQLWFVPRSSAAAELGVRNEEHAATVFRVKLFGPASQGSRLLLDRTVGLDSSRAWIRTVVLPLTARPERVNVELYRAGETAPYRSAHVWTTPGS